MSESGSTTHSEVVGTDSHHSSLSSRPRKRVVSVPASMSVIPSAQPPSSLPASEDRSGASLSSASHVPAVPVMIETDVARLRPALPGPADADGPLPSTATMSTVADRGGGQAVVSTHTGIEADAHTSPSAAVATPLQARNRQLFALDTTQCTADPLLKRLWDWLHALLLGVVSALLYLVTFGRAGELRWLGRGPHRGDEGDAQRGGRRRGSRGGRGLLHDGVDTALRLADKVFLRIETELEPESESEVTTPVMGIQALHRKRVIGNARIRNALARVPASSLQKPFRVHTCTWNVDQRPPPDTHNMDFLAWLVGAPAAEKIRRYREHCETHKRQATTLEQDAPITQDSTVLSPLDRTTRTAHLVQELADAVREFPDLILVSLQEVDMGGVALVRESTSSSKSWTDAIIETTLVASERKVQYKKVKMVQLVGLVLLVLVQAKHAVYISHVRLSLTRTGPMKMLGNKGSVGMRATIYGKRFLFVSAHFVAHKHNERKRYNNYHQALRDLRFELPPGADDEIDVLSTFENAHFQNVFTKDSFVRGRSTWDRVLRAARFGGDTVPVGSESRLLDRHDYVFFLGDLNSRLHGIPGEDIRRGVRLGELNYLLSHDELRQGMVTGDVFDGFEEPTIVFPPTYKFNRETDEYDTSRKHRDPAWCDRVVFRVLNLSVPAPEPSSAASLISACGESGLTSLLATDGAAATDGSQPMITVPMSTREPGSASEETPFGTALTQSQATAREPTDILTASCKTAASDTASLPHASSMAVSRSFLLPASHAQSEQAQPFPPHQCALDAFLLANESRRAFGDVDRMGLRRDEAEATAAAHAAGEEDGWIPLEELIKVSANEAGTMVADGVDVSAVLGRRCPSRSTSHHEDYKSVTSEHPGPTGAVTMASSVGSCSDVVTGAGNRGTRTRPGAAHAHKQAAEPASTATSQLTASADTIDPAFVARHNASASAVDWASTSSLSSPSTSSSPEISLLPHAQSESLSISTTDATEHHRPPRHLPMAMASPRSPHLESDPDRALMDTVTDPDLTRLSPVSSSAMDRTVRATFRAARFETDWSCLQRRFPSLPNTVEVVDYRSVPTLRMSDHRPVSAQFVVQVLAMKPEIVGELLRHAEEACDAAQLFRDVQGDALQTTGHDMK